MGGERWFADQWVRIGFHPAAETSNSMIGWTIFSVSFCVAKSEFST
jgi:hypothetical protein